MKSFIEEYLQNPAQAIAAARQTATTENWYDNIDEEMIYEQIASPQFRLYEAMIFASNSDNEPVRSQISA